MLYEGEAFPEGPVNHCWSSLNCALQLAEAEEDGGQAGQLPLFHMRFS